MRKDTIAQLFDLKGRVALVTGGGMGMGQGIAYRLAEAGAAVMIADINLGAANETVKEIKASGGSAQAVGADASSPADALKATQKTVEAFGRLDILVNNASIYPYKPFFDTTEQDWDKVCDLNLKGYFFCSQAAAREMVKEKHGGRIVNISSADALRPNVDCAPYSATKAGEAALTRALALELAPHGILVNAILPGIIRTPGLDVLFRQLQPPGVAIEDMVAGILQARVPLARSGYPDDVAKMVLVLASGAADYMTGACLEVNGGLLLR
ncbi:MAG: SDR family NAD(P)-dependent oxidoreductase [Chloroflexi bacterium]|nr:SDR family NAD(P)-dependent oxidoreductase [Chloroflexota bacterium]